MQSIVTFICLLQIGAIYLQYSHGDVIGSQIFIVILELKLQYSYICCNSCIVCVLSRLSYILVLMDKQGDFK